MIGNLNALKIDQGNVITAKYQARAYEPNMSLNPKTP